MDCIKSAVEAIRLEGESLRNLNFPFPDCAPGLHEFPVEKKGKGKISRSFTIVHEVL